MEEEIPESLYDVLIETLWNVKVGCYQLLLLIYNVLIETLWNVKTFYNIIVIIAIWY